MSQFPEFCETFILNEIVELEKRGIPFLVMSLKRCRDRQYQPRARELMERATVYPPDAWRPAHSVAHIWAVTTRLRAYVSTLRTVLRALPGPWSVFVKTLYVFWLAPWFARESRRRDLGHVHAHWASIPASAGLFVARIAGLPFSMTAHAYDIFIDQTLLREKIAAAHYVVTCTQYNRRYLLGSFPDTHPEKIRVAYHGTDLDFFDGRRDPDREEPLLLSVGRLCDTKGFPDLIEACRILRDRGLEFTCQIVGDGYMRAEIEAQILAARLVDRVKIVGLLTRDQFVEYYRRARVFVLPCVVTSRGDRDGLPNVVVEAMAMGLPVVATNVSALGEGVVDGKSGLLTPARDPQALADAIAQLWNDAAARRRMGAAGRERACAVFGLRETMDDLAGFIRRMHNHDA